MVVAFFLCWAPFHAQKLMTMYVQRPAVEHQTTNPLDLYDVALCSGGGGGLLSVLGAVPRPETDDAVRAESYQR